MLKKKMTHSLCFSLFIVSYAVAPSTFAASVETVGDLKVDGVVESTGGFKFSDGATLSGAGDITANSSSAAFQVTQQGSGHGLDATSMSGDAVHASAQNNGIYGESHLATGILGFTYASGGNNAGVIGSTQGSANGVWGASSSGNGVQGTSTSSTGVYGKSTQSIGILGYTSATGAPNAGVKGMTHSGAYGVFGQSDSTGAGVYAENNNVNGYALFAKHSATGGVAGHFEGNVDVTGGNITASGALTGHDGYFTSSLNLDQGDTNSGGLSGAVLTFGKDSGEGIASKRTGTGDIFGLDFYTGFNNRMSITNGGDVNVTGNVTVKGMMNMGSGTGTTEAPANSIIVRKTNSSNNTAGNKVAVTDWLALVRDGSNGGFSISNTSTGWSGVVSCMGMNSSNVSVNKYLEVGPGPVTTALFSDSDGVVYFQCNFGDPYNYGRITHVSLFRKAGDYAWLGTIISDVNQ